MSHIYMFPGQGSQSIGMGADLFDHYSDLVNIADTYLGYSIKTLCLEDPLEQLNQTQFTQPALYVVNALHFHHMQDEGITPEIAIGHSLGEYNAL